MTEAATAPPDRDRSDQGPRWGLGDAAAGFVVSLLGGQVAITAILGATGRSFEDLDELPLSLVALGQMGLWLGLLGAPVLATRLKGRGMVTDLGFRGRWSDIWIGGVIGGLTQLPLLPVLYAPILWLLDKTQGDVEGPARELTDRAVDPLGVVLLILIVAVGAPIMEEIFYRGLLQRSLLKRGLPPPVAIAITSVVFGLSHFQALQLPGLIVAGAVFGVLAHQAGRLGPAIAAHVVFNTVSVVALLAA